MRFASGVAELPQALSGAQVLLLWDFTADGLGEAIAGAKDIVWVHSASAGVDQLPYDVLSGRDIAVTNARGIFDRPIAEFVLGFMLDFAKGTHETLRAQAAHQWKHRLSEDLAGTSALVVGTGGIGGAIATLLAAVGVRATGAGTRPRTGDPRFGTVIDSSTLPSVAGHFDWIINAAPLTPATTGLYDAAVFQAMKPTARFINIGRGPSVVTEDLVMALRSGEIAGSALDVVDPEPLPTDHPLWTLPGSVVTPHMSGDTHDWEDRLVDQFVENLRRFTAGEPLLNAVDVSKGYAAS